jgi:hypothetical protein
MYVDSNVLLIRFLSSLFLFTACNSFTNSELTCDKALEIMRAKLQAGKVQDSEAGGLIVAANTCEAISMDSKTVARARLNLKSRGGFFRNDAPGDRDYIVLYRLYDKGWLIDGIFVRR